MPFPYLTSGAPSGPVAQGQPSYFPSFEQVFPWLNPQWTPPVATTGRFGLVPGYGFGRRGLLDQGPDISPMFPDPRMGYGQRGQDISGGLLDPRMIQRVADIIKLYGKGGLNPYTEMRDPGIGGGRGLLGSKWRDPNFIQQYEVQQGLRPGSLRPVESPRASVTDIAPPQSFPLGRRSQLGSGIPKLPDMPLPTAPTAAQMARPVRMTPEIAAKLQAARDARAAGEGMRLVEDTRALMAQRKGMKPFDSKVIADRFNKLSSDQAEIFNREMFPWDYNK
jgi:hypothetical protein